MSVSDSKNYRALLVIVIALLAVFFGTAFLFLAAGVSLGWAVPIFIVVILALVGCFCAYLYPAHAHKVFAAFARATEKVSNQSQRTR
jgi:fatty acid desaturase